MYRTAAQRNDKPMTEAERLAKELADLETEGAALDAEDGLTANEREMREKIRATKLGNIAKRAAKKHGKVFPVDLDAKGTLPSRVMFQGQDCILHTQFVVRGLVGNELDGFSKTIQAIDDDDVKKHDKRKAATRDMIMPCIVFPVAEGRSNAEHALDILASFDRFPALEVTLADEITSLGGMIAKANRKSVG
jgi:hypothetical protein